MRAPRWIDHMTLVLGGVLAACHGSSAEPTRSEPPARSAAAATAVMDPRTPVPLTAMMAMHQKRDMRDHLRVVQEVTAALAVDDFDRVATSAARIGWSEQQAGMCKHMGAGAPGFAEVGEHFHKTADQIGEAARRRDRDGVIHALDATLRTCVGCHESYRQDVVAEVLPRPASAAMERPTQ